MAKETTKIITPDTETKVLQTFSFPVQGFTIQAETLEEAKAILAKKLSELSNNK